MEICQRSRFSSQAHPTGPGRHQGRFAGRIICLALLVGAAVATAQEEVTVQGEIVDLACYMTKGSKGPQHRACAQMCAKKGVPIGVLTDAGEVFLLVDNHDDPDPYEAAKKLAGDRAEVSGRKYERSGATAIMVTGAKGL
jgi:hypothetical protein